MARLPVVSLLSDKEKGMPWYLVDTMVVGGQLVRCATYGFSLRREVVEYMARRMYTTGVANSSSFPLKSSDAHIIGEAEVGE